MKKQITINILLNIKAKLCSKCIKSELTVHAPWCPTLS